MRLSEFERRTRSRRALRMWPAAVLVLAVFASTTDAFSTKRTDEGAEARRRAGSRFTLTGHNLTFQIFGNLVQCGINNIGEVCVDVFNSPTGGGGFWPGGTLNQYIFNSGLQLVGIIDPSDGTNPWAGDTTGSFVFDPKGTESHSSPRGGIFTGIWSSLDAEDLSTWPADAIITDAGIFATPLLGRRSVSQVDTWVRYWEGDPNLSAGRPHPLGIEFDTRSMLWNFPAGNEDILYFVYVFRNISNDPEFQAINEAKFPGLDLPDGGYTITNMYAAFAMDPDVGDDAGHNLTNAMLEFQLGVAFDADFFQASPPFVFPSTIHGPPFFASTGFIGVKYLKSPTNPLTGEDVGLTLFTQTTNPSQAGGFKDATGVIQLYRYLSGNIDTAAGDDPCSIPQGQVLTEKLCFVGSVPTDVRMVQSSGPFTLGPGEEATIVVAYIHAAPLAVPEYSQGNDLVPNTLPNVDSVRTLDRMMGYDAAQGSPRVDTLPGERFEDVVPTVPRSLLDKAKVAQAIFDAKFLVPFAPEPPRLTLIPGDGKVTVVWDPSPTETLGDPFADVALDPTNALCDLNYRRFDVEGYRIYRGTSAADLQLIAQFDFPGTSFSDRTGRLDQSILDPTDDCTAVFDPPVENDISGRVIQFPPGGRVELSSEDVIVIKSDTLPKPGQFPALSNNGVPFAFEDEDVVNGFRYVYAVTAFDVNSVKSAPGSLESPKLSEAVVPRKEGTNQIAGNLTVRMFGDDAVDLDPSAPLPTFNSTTALFSGPQPPADGIEYGFAGFVDKLVPPQGTLSMRIDSVIPGDPHEAQEGSTIPIPAIYYITLDTKTGQIQTQVPLVVHYYSDLTSKESLFPGVAAVDSAARLYGADSTLTLFEKVTLRHPGNWRTTAFGRGWVNGDPSRSKFSGVRWFEGANETLPEPYAGYCPDPLGVGCDETNVDPNRTGGQLPGVSTLFSIQGYNSVPSNVREMEGVLSTVWRAADIEFVWGAGGTVQSVRDLTHHVDVPFSPKVRASWGFLTSASFATVDPATTPDGRNDVITYSDFTCMDPIPTFPFAQPGGSRAGSYCSTPVDLQQTALLDQVRAASSSFAATATLPATGTGFGLYINGRTFIFQMDALPASGTRWVLRTYSGPIRHRSTCGDPCVVPNAAPYTWSPRVRPPAVPGLQFEMSFGGTRIVATDSLPGAVERVHPVPDPYYATSTFEVSPAGKVIRFINLPNRATIRIYSLSGVLVSVIQHDDPTGSGETIWDVRNRNNQFVASGVYFFHVVTPDGQEKLGRMTVINFAQ